MQKQQRHDHGGGEQDRDRIAVAIAADRQHHRRADDDRKQQHADQRELLADEFADIARRPAGELRRPVELEFERRPVMNGVPVEHRRERQQRQHERDPQPGARKLPFAPRRHEHKGEDCRSEQDRSVFCRQRQAGEQSGRQATSADRRIARADQRPDHREFARDQRGIRRELRHHQPVIGRGLRHQHDRNDVAVVAQHAPDDVGQQQLHQQHRRAGRESARRNWCRRTARCRSRMNHAISGGWSRKEITLSRDHVQ